jgi:hypothetical protein
LNKVEKRVTGIGGFKAINSKELVAYMENIWVLKSMITARLLVKDEIGNDCSTQWSPFK